MSAKNPHAAGSSSSYLDKTSRVEETKIPGLIKMTTFKFHTVEALNYLKEKMNPEFRVNGWPKVYAEALEAAKSFGPGGPVSRCWLQIKLLDHLHQVLFGIAAGPSPWHEMVTKMPATKSNSLSTDIMINPKDVKPMAHDEDYQTGTWFILPY
ncbi:hypothetical protein F4778DRAFT_95166 [Xylariomycetidae sp. FL2044]|nr:hypothetical protein F4778DRAFT_95166 [Xylariomycetidae sp. FL2044]